MSKTYGHTKVVQSRYNLTDLDSMAQAWLNLKATQLYNLPSTFVELTADGKYPALDGSLITNLSGGTGTVTSVGVTSTDLSIAGSPVTTSGDITLNINANAVTNAKLAPMAATTIKGNATGGSTNPSDLTGTQVTSLLSIFGGDLGVGGTKGLVPAPAAGDATKFLKADGTWDAPSGSGTVTSVSITAPAAGITQSGSPVTSAGAITLALADDLAAVEGLATTGIVRRTGTSTWSAGTAVGLTTEVTGTLPLGNGGTGGATAAAARLSLAIAGPEQVPIPATSMTANTTNGPSSGTVEMTTNKNMVTSFDFDATTSESAQFSIVTPKSWNEGTITFWANWTAASGSGTVIWGLQAVAVSNDDTLDVAFGTAQTVTDTLLTAYDNHQTPTSSAITIAGTPAENDLVNFRVYRDISDTLAVDAKLISVTVVITFNETNDS